MRVDDPAVDLGIAASIYSSLRDTPIDSQSIAIGELGLSGEVRTVSQIEKRMQEALKLGFKRIILPKNNLKNLQRDTGIELCGVDRIDDAVGLLTQ